MRKKSPAIIERTTSAESEAKLTENAKQARRDYKRNWNKRNKDKVKAAQEKYWERRAAAAAAQTAPQECGQPQ